MANVLKINQITFEDHGQDFLRWKVENGCVVSSEPFQSNVWAGCRIVKAESGEKVTVNMRGRVFKVAYPVESIDEVI